MTTADSYNVNTELLDTGVLETLFPSQELSKSVPTISIPDSLNDSPLLNQNEISAMPKPNNSIKSSNRFKTQVLFKLVSEEVLENLPALKSFLVDQIYIMQKKSKYCETLAHCGDSKILVKSLNDQVDFLKSEIKSKNAIITMILDDHQNKVGQPKPFGKRWEKSISTLMATTNTGFRPLENRHRWKADTNKDFIDPTFLKDDVKKKKRKKKNHDLNENDLIDNKSDSSKDKEKSMSNRNTKTKAPRAVILGDSILKNVYGISFQRLQILRTTLLQNISLGLK